MNDQLTDNHENEERKEAADHMLEGNPDRLRDAAKNYFTEYFRTIGGEAHIGVTGDLLRIAWTPAAANDIDQLLGLAVSLLKKGAYKQAEPILQSITSAYPEQYVAHLNYGMMLSDQNRLDDTINHLAKAVSLAPGHADAWNALGVAYQRNHQEKDAMQALRRSAELDPGNPYTLSNYGAILIKKDPQSALAHLQRAAQLLPTDQQTLYGYALCLLEVGRLGDADGCLRNAIDLSPFTPIAELCRDERTKIAARRLRNATDGQLRMDTGIDLSKEYAAAKTLFQPKQ